MHNILIKASSRYPIRRKYIKDTVARTIEFLQFDVAVEIDIEIVGDRKIKKLKKQYMGIDQVTDVLSFPLHNDLAKKNKIYRINHESKYRLPIEQDGLLHLGSIVVSYPQAQRQANVHKLTIDEEINQLIEHSIFHLVGIHHE